MAVTKVSAMYPFAEQFLVTSEGTTSITLVTHNADVIICGCQVETVTAATGSANLSVGAGSDADGLIAASDATAVAGTIYGDAVGDLGDDWKVATGASSGYCIMPGGAKYVANTAITFVLSAAPTTEGVYAINVWGFCMAAE